MYRRYLLHVSGALTLLATSAGLLSQPSAQPIDQKKPQLVDESGNIRVPSDYRERYRFLGSWAVASENGRGSKEMHVVYASPGAAQPYRNEGSFPDGATLVKEVYETSTGEFTTGTVSRADHLKGWFVMVRDAGNTHQDNPLWGEGWGWSWFDAGQPDKATTVSYRDECLGCHVPARSTNWIYVDGYPSLRK